MQADVAPRDSSFVDRIMTQFVELWKSPRSAIRDLIFSSVLPEFDFKRIFAVKFAQVCMQVYVCQVTNVPQHYVTMQREYVRDNEKHNESITAFSVQLLTVPSLAR